MNHSVHLNRLTLDFCNRFYALCNKDARTKVGISIFHGGFATVYTKLAQFPSGCSLDGEKYDKTLHPYIMRISFDIIWLLLACRTPENQRRYSRLVDELINTIVIMPDGTCWMKRIGNPSGCVVTVVINTIGLDYIHNYTYVTLCSRNNYKFNRTHRDACVTAALYGDDNVTTISAEASSWFTLREMMRCGLDWGMVFTSQYDELVPVFELDFLSNRPSYTSSGALVCVAESGTLISSAIYGCTRDNELYQTLRLMNLRVLAFGTDVFEIFSSYLSKWIADGGVFENFTIGDTTITTKDVKALFFSELQIERLYTGLEGESCPINHIYKRAQGWIRDLTEEGIEPQPGEIGAAVNQKTNLKLISIVTIVVLMPKTKKGSRKVVVFKPKAKKVRNAPRKTNKKRGRAVGGFTGGSKVSSMISSKLGSLARGAASRLFSHVTGHGAYDVKKNSLSSGRPPMFSARSGQDGSIEFMHSEFLTDVVSSTAFTLNNYNINPGMSNVYPFLSAIAINFEQYELLGQIYEFRSTSATAIGSTSTALGVVVMTTNYDVLDSNFVNKQQMEAYMFTTSCSPAESMLHPIECAKKTLVLDNLYTRTGTIPTGADQRFYDIGNFQIATVGMQTAGNVIGELWVTYHLRLLKPKLPTPLNADLLSAHMHESGAGTSTAALPFGTAADSVPRILSGSTLTIATSRTFVECATQGRYLITYSGISAQTLSAVPSFTYGANIVGVGVFPSSASFLYTYNIASGAFIALAVIDVAPGLYNSVNRITVNGPTGMTTGTGDFFIVQMSSGQNLSKTAIKSMDEKRGFFLDDLLSRLERLEVSPSFPRLCNGSITDDEEWKSTQIDDTNYSSSSNSTSSSAIQKSEGICLPRNSPQGEINKYARNNTISDSVIDLIANKLRK